MGLRAQAAADLAVIIEDTDTGFAWPVTVTTPEGVRLALKGLTSDVAQAIDPETGMIVSGRTVSVALRIAAFGAHGLPKSIPDSSKRPWLFEFDDINSKRCVFKVAESKPDAALGVVVCILEFYRYFE